MTVGQLVTYKDRQAEVAAILTPDEVLIRFVPEPRAGQTHMIVDRDAITLEE